MRVSVRSRYIKGCADCKNGCKLVLLTWRRSWCNGEVLNLDVRQSVGWQIKAGVMSLVLGCASGVWACGEAKGLHAG